MNQLTFDLDVWHLYGSYDHNSPVVKVKVKGKCRMCVLHEYLLRCPKVRKYGKGKYETAHFARVENACTENASTNLQGWKTQVRKMQVQCKPSVRQKKFGTSQVNVVHFQVGWESGLQIIFSDNVNNQK